MAEQQFVLRWNCHEATLMKSLPQLLDANVLTDVTLSAEGRSVKAHRLVLAGCSAYFLQLFQGMSAAQHPVLLLHNTGFEELKAVLAFVYRGQCLVAENQLPGLLAVAKSLQIQGLCDMKLPDHQAPPKAPHPHEDGSLLKTRLEREFNPRSTTGKNSTKEISLDYMDLEEAPFKKPLDSAPLNLTPPQAQDVTPFELEDKLGDIILNPDAYAVKTLIKDTTESCKCFICGKYLSNQYNLRVHMETHQEGYHACASCPHVSRSRDALRKHVSYRHPEECISRKRKKTDNY